MKNAILKQNEQSWDNMAHLWSNATALPVYGCSVPDEEELSLFPTSLEGKKVLDIGCGSGHSMLWCGRKGADELWGLDISARQVENARCLLSKHGFVPRLFHSPMEADCGLPKDYFDVVYSIYALGWTVDLPGTIRRIASYLKPGGSLIFSWDHPLMKCIEERDGMLVLEGCYLEDDFFSYLQKGAYPVTIQNHKMSSWINALADADFRIVRLVEETDQKTLEREEEFSSGYYSTVRAKKIPLSMIVKAIKC